MTVVTAGRLFPPLEAVLAMSTLWSCNECLPPQFWPCRERPSSRPGSCTTHQSQAAPPASDALLASLLPHLHQAPAVLLNNISHLLHHYCIHGHYKVVYMMTTTQCGAGRDLVNFEVHNQLHLRGQGVVTHHLPLYIIKVAILIHINYSYMYLLLS